MLVRFKKKYKNLSFNKQKGAAMLISVLFFIFISLGITSGLVAPAVREFKTSKIELDSKKTFYLAESGVEDAFYRIIKSKPISSSETLTLNGSSVDTTITTLAGGEKEITSLADIDEYQRQVNLKLETSEGVSFNYGVQVGTGGVYLDSGAIYGNVYANGPITASGSGSNLISGTAISGNSPALSADQSNGSGTPAYNITFGNASATQDVAQSFQVSTESPINKVRIYLKKTGSPSDAVVKIVRGSTSSPSTTVVASGTLSASLVMTTYGWVEVSFSSNPLLDPALTYWLVIDANTSSSKYYTIGASGDAYADGLAKIGQQGSSWNNTTPSNLDYYFGIYLGGINGLIQGNGQWTQLRIGTTSGSAQAHTVNYVNATGNIYCQSGTGNNKSCTNQPDPVYVALPVSEANIDGWKAEAEGWSVYNGNLSVGWEGNTLGPKKINGNLTVSGGGILTLTGPLWVTGSVSLSGGGQIKLSPTYGSDDGFILAENSISISGGGRATGSGQAGSYIMLLTLSSSDTAMSVSGGAGAVIVCAPYGTVNVSGGASLKEAVGNRLVLTGGSTITYESGLADNNFSSGPSGSWSVSGWQEE